MPSQIARFLLKPFEQVHPIVREDIPHRLFAAPILANCALAPARLPTGVAWEEVPALPFELACLPQECFQWLKLGVVSYALPALIAVGQVRHARQPSRNLFLRALRSATVGPALRRLETIQPRSGGFLEATPLTSFVVMSLAAAGRSDHPVARRGLEFLLHSVRADGSWPVDTNLSLWLTCLSVAALATGAEVLLLDEVMAGLTPAEVEEALEILKKIRTQGRTLILVEHVMRAVMGISERIIVLNHGEKIAEGTPEEVAKAESSYTAKYLNNALANQQAELLIAKK
jgi:hypothetical protein